eukprot:scaffold334_cov191-Alexandrium_tamarense.AAC.8
MINTQYYTIALSFILNDVTNWLMFSTKLGCSWSVWKATEKGGRRRRFSLSLSLSRDSDMQLMPNTHSHDKADERLIDEARQLKSLWMRNSSYLLREVAERAEEPS